MKVLTIFLIALFFFSAAICMERCNSDKLYSTRILKEITFEIERLRLWVLLKNIPEIEQVIKLIQRTGSHLEIEDKNEVTNTIIYAIKLLPLTEEWQKLFDAEFCSSSALSSNDPSPRIEDNNPFEKFGKEDQEILLKTQLTNILVQTDQAQEFGYTSEVKKKRNKIHFLGGIIDKLGRLKKEIQEIESPLRMSALNGKFERFESTYEKYEGFLDPDYRNSVNKAYMHYAVSTDCLPMLEYLLAHGANLEVVDMHGQTPLRLAIKEVKRKAVDFLLEHNANPFMSDKGGVLQKQEGSYVRLDHITTEQSLDILCLVPSNEKQMKASLASYIKHLPNDSLFKFFAQAGKLKDMERLLGDVKALGFDQVKDLVNSVDEKYGKSALHYGIEKKEPYVICFLIREGVDPDIQDFEGNTALHCAVIGNYKAGVILLLYGHTKEISNDLGVDYKGALMNLTNKHGYTAQRLAQLLLYKEIVDVFWDKERNEIDLYTYQPDSYESGIDLEMANFLLADSKQRKIKAGEKEGGSAGKRKERRKSLSFSSNSLRKALGRKNKGTKNFEDK